MDDKININKISEDSDVSVIMFWRTLADWLFHYISMWFCVVTSNTWANTHTNSTLRNSNTKNTWKIYHIVAHIETHTHTHHYQRWFCIFPYFIWDFSVIFHSFTCFDCLHLFFPSPDHFVCIFHVARSYFTIACHLSICPENIEQFRASGGLCVTNTHALITALILKLKFTSSSLIFR